MHAVGPAQQRVEIVAARGAVAMIAVVAAVMH